MWGEMPTITQSFRFIGRSQVAVQFHLKGTHDHEVYDRFCHSQDRAYTVPGRGLLKFYMSINIFSEVEDWLKQAGLHFVDFNFRRDKHILSIQNLDLDIVVRNAVNQLSFMEKYAFAELFHGSFDNHNFYISKKNDSVASIEDQNNIPFFFGNPINMKEHLKGDLKKINAETQTLKSNLQYEYQTFLNHGIYNISLHLTNYTGHIIDYLLEGKLPISDLLTEIEAQKKISPQLIMSELRHFYNNISRHDLLLLRDKSVQNIDVLRNIVLFKF